MPTPRGRPPGSSQAGEEQEQEENQVDNPDPKSKRQKKNNNNNNNNNDLDTRIHFTNQVAPVFEEYLYTTRHADRQ